MISGQGWRGGEWRRQSYDVDEHEDEYEEGYKENLEADTEAEGEGDKDNKPREGC